MNVFQYSKNGKMLNYLVMVDHYSDFIEVDFLPDMKPRSVIDMCMCIKNFSRYGIPATVCTDKATNFVCEEFRNFVKS